MKKRQLIVLLFMNISPLNYPMNFFDERDFCEAIENNDCATIGQFLDKDDAYKDYKFNDGTMALHQAAQHDAVDVARLLLEKGANPNCTDSCMMTPLHYASLFYSKNVVNFFLQRGGFFDSRHIDRLITQDKSPNANSIAFLLLKYNANIQAQDNNGDTAMHFAANLANVDLLRLFLDHKAAINTKNKSGMTILHYALIQKKIKVHFPFRKEALKLLLKHGGDWSVKDLSGKTIYDYLDPDLQEVIAAYARRKCFLFLYGEKDELSPVSKLPKDLQKEVINHVLPKSCIPKNVLEPLAKKRSYEEDESFYAHKKSKME